MTPSEKTLAQILQIEGNQENYFVPKYQRPYVWKRDNWDDLLRDLEEDEEHFMGSVICVPRFPLESSPGDRYQYELIDGQQRMTTISILLCSVYRKLADCRPLKSSEELVDEWKELRSSIYKKLISEKSGKLSQIDEPVEIDGKKSLFSRVTPSLQGSNRDDYNAVLHECGALKQQTYPPHWGNRRISKAYLYFLENIPSDVEGLKRLVTRINNLQFIHISVSSHSDAYRLFESLNNRGEPLSALDIIKNNILARVDRDGKPVDDAFQLWKGMIDRLGEEESIHERYLRHFYHAFRNDKNIFVSKYPRATRSTIIKIYTELINKNAVDLLSNLASKAILYQALIFPNAVKQAVARTAILNDLLRIGAAPAHQALLYFLQCECDEILEDKLTFVKIAEFLTKYFVRRNITNQPSTNKLDALFSSIINAAQAEKKKNETIGFAWFHAKMTNNANDLPASDEAFREELETSLWYYNPGMARYVLCRLNESFTTREYDPNIWKQDDRGRYVWTVEHVLPQSERLRREWIEMIADGDNAKAVEIQDEWCHCLGNLTLSGYNSKLSDLAFAKKKEKSEMSIEGDKLQIGYRNKLPLNEFKFSVAGKETSLATAKTWTVAEIKARNTAIVDKCLKIFKL